MRKMAKARVGGRAVAGVGVGFVAAVLAGCAGERALVPISYVVEPSRGLPPGVQTIAVKEAKVNDVTDRKWSELAANMIQDHLHRAATKYGAPIHLADRKHLRDTMAEQDLAAAGVTRSSTAGRGGQVTDVQGIIESEINVKVETHHGTDTTVAGLNLAGGGGRHHGWGAVDVQTREVQTTTRNMTVQTSFRLVDAVSNRNLATHSPAPYSQSDRTKVDPLFGSGKTEADMTPRDEVISGAVRQGVVEFVSQLVPTEVHLELAVESSGNPNCTEGVRALRGEAYERALAAFKAALAEDPNDHRAAFGAGAACEALRRHDEAQQYYRQAYSIVEDSYYRDSRDRLTADAHRRR